MYIGAGTVAFEAMVAFPTGVTTGATNVEDASTEVEDVSQATPLKHDELEKPAAEVETASADIEASVEVEIASIDPENASVEVEKAVSATCLLFKASSGTSRAMVLITGTGVTTTVLTGGAAVSQTGVVKNGAGIPGQEV